MELKGVTVKTDSHTIPYVHCRPDLMGESTVQYGIILEIPIPGGKVEFTIPTSKEINTHIETAMQMMGKYD